MISLLDLPPVASNEKFDLAELLVSTTTAEEEAAKRCRLNAIAYHEARLAIYMKFMRRLISSTRISTAAKGAELRRLCILRLDAKSQIAKL